MTSYSGSVLTDLDDRTVRLNSGGTLETIDQFKFVGYIAATSTTATTETSLGSVVVSANTLSEKLIVDVPFYTYVHTTDTLGDAVSVTVKIYVDGTAEVTRRAGLKIDQGTTGDWYVGNTAIYVGGTADLDFSTAHTVEVKAYTNNTNRPCYINDSIVYGI